MWKAKKPKKEGRHCMRYKSSSYMAVEVTTLRGEVEAYPTSSSPTLGGGAGATSKYIDSLKSNRDDVRAGDVGRLGEPKSDVSNV
eukprot:m.261660 g.261660  ORF g.261660 m.261660 type:complete len:85 (-) comp15580_c0_seq6:4462-4716(-)